MNRIEYPRAESNLVNYQLLAAMILKYPDGKLLVAADHNQLRTMA